MQQKHGCTQRGTRCHDPRFGPVKRCYNMNFTLSQVNIDCSPFSLILLLLDRSCDIFALSIVIALSAWPFSIQKTAKTSVFLCQNCKNLLADLQCLQKLGASPPDPRLLPLPPPALELPIFIPPCIENWSILLNYPTQYQKMVNFAKSSPNPQHKFALLRASYMIRLVFHSNNA